MICRSNLSRFNLTAIFVWFLNFLHSNVQIFEYFLNYKNFLSKTANISGISLILFQRRHQKFFFKDCGVMKLGRHALLSRGWGVRDKHSVMPSPTKIGLDWG